MNKEISAPGSIEEKKWYKNVKSILAIFGTIVVIISGIIAIANSDIFKTKKISQNIEILLDSSASSHEDFGGITKIEAIKDAMGKVLDLNVGENENVALRQFGGICNDINEKKTKRLVDFGTDNRRNILNALDQISISGQTTLVEGIVNAASDFSQERFENVNKKIIVITSNSDACWPDAAQIIQTRLQNYNISQIDFWIIGMGLSQNQQMEVKNISTEFKGEARFVNSNKDLENDLTNAIEQPKRKNSEIDAKIVSLNFDKDRYSAGEPIIANLTIENTGKMDITSEEIVINATVKSLDNFISNIVSKTMSEKEKSRSTSIDFIGKISPQSLKSVNAEFKTEQEMYGLKLAGIYSVTISLYVNGQWADATKIEIKLY